MPRRNSRSLMVPEPVARAPVQQPRHAERHVEHVLDVVVVRVALAEPGKIAPVKAPEVAERLRQVARGVLLVELLVNPADFLRHDLWIGRVDAVGDVVVAASARLGCHPAPGKTRNSFDGFSRVLHYNELDRATLNKIQKENIFPGACAIFHARPAGGKTVAARVVV